KVVYQRRSRDRHEHAVETLRASGRAFDCGCSRSDLPDSGVYPGTCRSGLAAGRAARSVRFRVPADPIRVVDAVFGARQVDLERDCGDFVIRRADGLIAYQLAVVVDDAAQAVTEVVRGADLLDSTPRQQALFEALGLPLPRWMHLPVVVDRKGRKLSKSRGDDPLAPGREREALVTALTALGHAPPTGVRSLESVWKWARKEWNPDRIPTEPFEAGVVTRG
ncbi:MAG: glutamate--tRNA ligase family protein, partial [Wenzhouxiangellaceae bacterium]|nr:glutamate--tRNA ligase family protein [Wenzhouxiangellaceae bacterium]